MNSVPSLIRSIDLIRANPLVGSVRVMTLGRTVLKARISILHHTFVQAYRNDRFSTTSFALVFQDKRIYGRDEVGGSWHRHPFGDPLLHDRSAEGRRAIDLIGFWVESLEVLRKSGLLA